MLSKTIAAMLESIKKETPEILEDWVNEHFEVVDYEHGGESYRLALIRR